MYINSFFTKFPDLQTNREIRKQYWFVYFRYIMSNILHTQDTKGKIEVFLSDLRKEMEYINPSEIKFSVVSEPKVEAAWCREMLLTHLNT